FAAVAYQVASLGIEFHFEAVSRGVLDSRDLAYFVSVVAVFLAATYVAVLRGRRRPKVVATQVLTVVAGVIALNLLASWFAGRVDFTADNRFTRSPVSIETVQALQAPVQVTVLLDGELPAGFERLKRATVEL